MSEEADISEKKSDIDELKEAMDDYLTKSAEMMNTTTNENQDIKSEHPSLSVSEYQTHSNPSSTTPTLRDPEKQNKYKKFYQFLFISIMIGCIAIFISLIIRFRTLNHYQNDDTAWLRYLHKAIIIKKHDPNESILNCCHNAIHDDEIVKVYKSANIELGPLKAEMEEVMHMKSPLNSGQESEANSTALNRNHKHELILKCDVELSLMMHDIMSDNENLRNNARLSKSHKKAYDAYLFKAVQMKQEHPNLSYRDTCQQAIDDKDLNDLWEDAEVDVNGLFVRIEAIMHAIKSSNDDHLNRKEKLIMICEYELEKMTTENDREVKAEINNNKK